MTDEFQLELWVQNGRKGRWEIAPLSTEVPRHPWRRVKKGHKHRDKLPHSIAKVKSCGYARDEKQQVEAYCQWARLKGLTSIAVYLNHIGPLVAKAFGFALRVVDEDTPATVEECAE